MRNRELEFKESEDGKMFTIGNIITCPNDSSDGAEWQIMKIDKKGNIHAELINKEHGSRFYVKNDTITITPDAYDKWDITAFE